MIALLNRAVSRLPRMNLRERFTVLATVGVAVFFATFSLVGARAVLESTNETLRERLASAQATAQYVDRLLVHSQQSLADVAAGAPPMAESDPVVMENYLRDHVPHGEGYAFLAVVDESGHVVVAVPPQPDLQGQTIAAQDLAPALDRGLPVVTNLLRLPGSDRPYVCLAVPFGSNRTSAARLLLGAIDLSEPAATHYVGLAHIGGTGDVQLVDANGMVINHTQPDLRFQPSEHQELFRSLLQTGLATVTTHSVSHGQTTMNRVITFAPLHTAPWGVAEEQDETEVFAVANRLRGQLGGLALAFGVMAISMVWVTTSRVLRPVSALTQAARRLAGGDLETPVPVRGGDELGALSVALDDMRRKLRDSYKQIESLYKQAKTRHSREQSMLLRFSQDMLTMADPQWTLDRTAGVAATLTAADGASVMLMAGDSAVPTMTGVHAVELGRDGRGGGAEADEIRRLVTGHREPVLVNDFLTDQRFSILPIIQEHGVRSGLAVPMLTGDMLVGVLYVYSHKPDAFDQQDADVLALLANQAALASEKARLLAESTRRYREMSILFQLSQSIVQALSVEELCERLVNALQDDLAYEHADVLIRDEATGELVSQTGGNEDADPEARSGPQPQELAGGIRARAVRTGLVVRVDDVTQDPDYVARRPNVRSKICVPIQVGDKIAGVIDVESSRLSAFTPDDERLLVAVAGPVGMVLERTRLFEEARRRADEFASLYEIGTVVGSSLQLDQVLHSVVSSAMTLLDADACSLMLIDQSKGELTVQAAQGASTIESDETCQRVGEGIAGWVAQNGQPLLVQGDQLPPQLRHVSVREHVTSAISVPLKASGRTLGVINVSSLGQRRFADSDVQLLSRLAADAALALDNAHLYDELRRSFLETVAALAQAVDAKDPYTRGHSERVTDLALSIAQELKVPPDDMDTLRTAAVLHDIGKIGIAEQILRKPGPLNDQEWTAMRTHPDLGADIVGPVSALHRVVPVLQHHHERWDGSGYPSGLSGEDIPLGSRILAVADAYEAMTSDRAYRAAMPVPQAMTILKEGAGRQWDPRVVHAFVRLMEPETSQQETPARRQQRERGLGRGRGKERG